MDSRVVSSLLGAILFLIMASGPVFNMIRKAGVKDPEVSLVIRSALVGVLMYLSMMTMM